MLIGFRLRNFLSYSAEQSFSLASSADAQHLDNHVVQTSLRAVPRVSKVAVILGPNGSGKTNLLLALSTLRQLVLQSHGWDELQFRQRYTPSSHCREPTEFRIEVLIGTTRYRYALAYCGQRIRFERLEVHTSAKSQRWYERRSTGADGGERWTPFSSSFFGTRELWRRSTGPRELFLTTAARLGSAQLAPLVKWFWKCMDIGLPSEEEMLDREPQRIHEPAYKARLLRMFDDIDIPLADMRVHPVGRDSAMQTRIEAPSVTVELKHKRPSGDVWISPQFESAGTKRVLHLFARFLAAVDYEKLLVLDEFDLNLHVLVARYLIGLLSSAHALNNRAQLLVTTHKAALVDLSMFRRDEVWFSHLDEGRNTILYQLSSRGARKHEAVMKAYLGGRYGAVPSIRPVAQAAEASARAALQPAKWAQGGTRSAQARVSRASAVNSATCPSARQATPDIGL